MARRSAASLAVAAVDPTERPGPWPGLTPVEAEYWVNVAQSLPASWFRPSDLPLLAAYCKAAVRHDEAVARLEHEDPVIVNKRTGGQSMNPNFKIADMAIRQMASLAGKLRLCPSSRYDEKQASTKVKNAGDGKKPWARRA